MAFRKSNARTIPGGTGRSAPAIHPPGLSVSNAINPAVGEVPAVFAEVHFASTEKDLGRTVNSTDDWAELTFSTQTHRSHPMDADPGVEEIALWFKMWIAFRHR